MELFTLGIDLGKTTFHLVGMNQREKWCCGNDSLERSSCTVPRT
jgi:hypothetical protein